MFASSLLVRVYSLRYVPVVDVEDLFIDATKFAALQCYDSTLTTKDLIRDGARIGLKESGDSAGAAGS